MFALTFDGCGNDPLEVFLPLGQPLSDGWRIGVGCTSARCSGCPGWSGSG